MSPKHTSPTRRILILKEDRLYAAALRQVAHRAFPGAHVTLASSVASATAHLAAGPCDLFISGIGPALDGDVLELLLWLGGNRPNTRALVVTADRQYRTLDALRRLEFVSVFDTRHESPDDFFAVLKTSRRDNPYWSPSLLEFLEQTQAASNALQVLLTPGEQVALSVLGDGSDNTAAARQLGLSPTTVSTVRRELHRKLRVQHRGELIRVAAQNGFVHFTPDGIVRPGFTLFAAEYYARRGRRSHAPAPTLPAVPVALAPLPHRSAALKDKTPPPARVPTAA